MLGNQASLDAMLDFDTILGPLVGICRRRDLKMQWRTYPKDGAWEAVVHAGRRDGDGAQPQWLGKGLTEAAALEDAAGSAARYWDDRGQHGISQTLLDLVRR
jgi:hypothetical protein